MPENIIGEAAIALRANFQEFQEDLGKVQKEVEKAVTPIKKNFESIGDSLKHVGDKMSDVGKNMSLKVTAPIVAAGAASMKAWADVDNAMDTIITKTGAMGDKADELEQAFKNVATTLPADMQTVAEAIGEVNTQFGLVGENLEDATRKLVQFATLNEVDVSSATLNAKRAIEVFGLTAKDVGEVLDSVNYVAQSTGMAVDQVFEAAVRGAPQIKALGLSFGEGALLMGKFQQAGLDTSKALSYLARAQVEFAKDGKTLQEGLAELQKKLLSSKDSTEALTLASTYFGTKGATIMLDAIQRGVLDLGDLAAAAEQAGGSVGSTFSATLDPIDQMKVLMNNLKLALAEVGTSLQTVLEPALNKVIEAVQKFADWFNNLSPAAKNLIVTIGLLAAALGPLLLIIGQIISVVGTLTSFLPVLGGAFTLLTGPIGLVVAAVAGAIAIGVALWKNWDEVKAFLKNIWDAIAQTATNIWNGIVDFFKGIWESITANAKYTWDTITGLLTTVWKGISSTASNIWNGIATFFSQTWGNISNVTSSVWQGITGFLGNTWTSISSVATSIWSNISSFLSQTWSNVSSFTTSTWSSLSGFLNNTWTGIKNFGTTLWTGLKDAITTQTNTVKNTLSTVWSSTSTLLSNTWTNIKNTANTLWTNMKDIISNQTNTVKNTLSSVWSAVSTSLSSTWSSIKNTASTMWSGIKDVVTAQTNTVKNTLSSVWSAVSTLLSNTWGNIRNTASNTWGLIKNAIVGNMEPLKNTLSSLWSGISSSMNSVWNGLLNSAKSIFSNIASAIVAPFKNLHIPLPHFKFGTKNVTLAGITFPVPDIKVEWYKKGGIFSRPTIIGVGEAGPEAVVPLSQGRLIDYDKMGQAVAKYLKPSVTLETNIYSGQPLSPSEIKRKQEQLLRQLAMEW